MIVKLKELDKTTVPNILPISTGAVQEDGLVQKIAAQAVHIPISGADGAANFPNLAWESIKIGLAKEQITNGKLNGHIRDAEKLQKGIDLLLDLSAELTAHKDDAKEASPKIKTLLAELKGHGIDLWKGEDGALTKEKISELKTLASAQIDKLRSNLQIIFTTKIQVLIQTVGSIMETLKDIIRNNTKLINAANRLPGR